MNNDWLIKLVYTYPLIWHQHGQYYMDRQRIIKNEKKLLLPDSFNFSPFLPLPRLRDKKNRGSIGPVWNDLKPLDLWKWTSGTMDWPLRLKKFIPSHPLPPSLPYKIFIKIFFFKFVPKVAHNWVLLEIFDPTPTPSTHGFV